MNNTAETTLPIDGISQYKHPYGAHIRPTSLTIRYSTSEWIGHAAIQINGEKLGGPHGHPYAALDWFARTDWPDWARRMVVDNIPDGFSLPDLEVYCGGRDCAECTSDEPCCEALCGVCSRSTDCTLSDGAYENSKYCPEHRIDAVR